MLNSFANNLISIHSLDAQKNRFSQLPTRPRIRTRFDSQTELADGRYIIEHKITDGGCAELYLALDTKKKRPVALKIFGDSRLLGQDNWNVCRTEARLHDKISTARAVKVYDFHICKHGGGEIFILSMEYLNGITFRKWLGGNKEYLDIRHNEGIALFHKMCLCVQDIHNSAFSHLDIKPENFLFIDNDVKIIDFGTAAFISSLNDDNRCCVQIPSTPAYMAPELFTVSYADDLTPAADIYSLGIIFYEIVSPDCRPPFDGSPERLRILHTNLGIGPEHLNKIDHKYRAMLNKCLHRDPLQRFQNIGELIAELNDITAEKTDDSQHSDNHTIVELMNKLNQKTASIVNTMEKQNPSDINSHRPKLNYSRFVRLAIEALGSFQWDKTIDYLHLANQAIPNDHLIAKTIGKIEEFLASVDIQRHNIEDHIANHQYDIAFEELQSLENYINQTSGLKADINSER